MGAIFMKFGRVPATSSITIGPLPSVGCFRRKEWMLGALSSIREALAGVFRPGRGPGEVVEQPREIASRARSGHRLDGRLVGDDEPTTIAVRVEGLVDP